MSEVSVRISELQNAAERLKQSAFRLQMAVDGVVPIVDQSLLDALPLSENALLYQSHKANIASMPSRIQRFADNLTTAADDIMAAVDGQSQPVHVVHFYAPKRVTFNQHSNASLLLGNHQGTNATPFPDKMTLEDYVSSRNRPLYDELRTRKDQLNDKNSALALLVNQRTTLTEDMTALKNRMLSFDPTTPVDSQPRVVALQGQIDQIDLQITDLKQDIHLLQTDVKDLTQRLDRVTPAVGADVDAILALEGAQNPQWMKNSTFGCVNHIVEKMPLPNGVPRDALLWDDAARQLPQYGISWGDTPLEGSVLQLDPSHPYADDQYGHVLYVERVEGNTVWVTDNIHPDEPVRLDAITSKLSGDDMRYLYFPWHTGA